MFLRGWFQAINVEHLNILIIMVYLILHLNSNDLDHGREFSMRTGAPHLGEPLILWREELLSR